MRPPPRLGSRDLASPPCSAGSDATAVLGAAQSLLLAAALTLGSPALSLEIVELQGPSAESQATLRRAFSAAQSGLSRQADKLLSESISEWQRTRQPPDETAALFKTRGIVRYDAGDPSAALADFSEAIRLDMAPGSNADPAEVQRTYQLRARAYHDLSRWSDEEADLSAAIQRLDDLSILEATNPYLYTQRAAARAKLGDFSGAIEDHQQAEADYRMTGDKIRRTITGADLALALYGGGDEAAAVEQMRSTFKAKGIPATNNPDDIGLLQELSRKDAELHLAYAAHLFHAGRVADASKQWESGCIRIEAYVRDGLERLEEERALQEREALEAEARGREEKLRASSVAGQPFNADFNARLNGMDPNSPYVTQRSGQAYFWYKEGEGSIERRDRGYALARIEPGLSCTSFRDPAWIRSERPEWPPLLVQRVKEYADSVPQQPIIMPKKGSPPSDGEVNF